MAGQIQLANTNPLARPVMRTPLGGPAGLTPKEMLVTIRRHIFMIITFTITGLIIGGVLYGLLYKFRPRYTATGYVEVIGGQKNVWELTALPPNKDIYYIQRFTKAAEIRQLNILMELVGRQRVQATKWFAQFCDYDASGNIKDKDAAITKAVENLQNNLDASAPRDATWIQVSMSCESKKEAVLIVNELVSLFLNRQGESATSDVRDQLTQLTTQKNTLEGELRTAEDTLNTIRAGTSYVNLDNTVYRDYMSYTLSDIEIRKNQLESMISNLDSTIKTLRQRAEGEYDEVVREEMERDTIALEIRRNLSILEPILAEQLARFGEDHRRVKETKDQIEQLRNNLAKRQVEIADIIRQSNLRNAQDMMKAQEQQKATLVAQLEAASRQYKEMDDVKARYLRTLAARDEKRELVKKTNELIEQLNMQKDDPARARLKPLGPAMEPLRISSPRWEFYLPGGFILGLLAGVVTAFAIEMLNDLLRSPSDVNKNVNIPLLGMICHTDQDSAVEGINLYHAVRQAPYSIMGECYRQLRTNLKLIPTDGTCKTFLLTSINAGDGKTTVAVNTAVSLVADGKKVLLIDASFRRPAIGKIFPETSKDSPSARHPDFGLSNYLMGQAEIGNTIRTSGIEGLDIINSGPLPTNPSELLASSRFGQLLDTAGKKYDFVLIDGPAMLVSDAKTLSTAVNGTILVFNTAATRKGAAQRTVRELREINAKVIGCVLVGVQAMKGGYFEEIFRLYEEYQKVQVTQPV